MLSSKPSCKEQLSIVNGITSMLSTSSVLYTFITTTPVSVLVMDSPLGKTIRCPGVSPIERKEERNRPMFRPEPESTHHSVSPVLCRSSITLTWCWSSCSNKFTSDVLLIKSSRVTVGPTGISANSVSCRTEETVVVVIGSASGQPG